MKDYDVTIIGAGLAGLYCGRVLAEHGLRVLLVDRKRSLTRKIHTTGIFVRKTLEDFEIPEEYLGATIRHVNLYSPSRRFLELTSAQDEFRIGRMGRLYLHYLSRCRRAGVTWLSDTNYLDHRLEKGKLAVRFATGNSVTLASTSYLIGADGTCSRVAADLHLDQNREWIVGVEDVFHDVSIPGPPKLFCFLDPKIAPGYIAWIAWDGEEAHVGVGGYPSRFDPISALEHFRNSVSDIVDLKNARAVERRGGRIPVGGVLRSIANSKGLLIGDAAGAVSPLTAGGLDPCLRLSSLAAKVVIEYLTSGNKHILAAYTGDLFRARFTSRLFARRVIASLPSSYWANVICSTLRLPLMTRLARHVFFGRHSFPNVDLHITRSAAPSFVKLATACDVEATSRPECSSAHTVSVESPIECLKAGVENPVK